MENIEIRDFRKKDFFWLDDAYLNGYAKLCGIYATGVYLSLCRHANKNQQSWPSLDLIAEELNLGSTNTVVKAIKQLEKWNIIKVERTKNKETKRQNPNIYTLLDKSVWKEKPTSRDALGSKADLISDADPTSFDDEKPTSRDEVEGKHIIEPDTKNQTHENFTYLFNHNGFNQVWRDYKEMRNGIRKPMKTAAEKLALKKLDQLCGLNVDLAIEILEQSIFNGWQGLFPIKQIGEKLDDYQKALKVLDVIRYENGKPNKAYLKKVWNGIDLAAIKVALESFYPDQMELLPRETSLVIKNLDVIKKHLI